LKKRKNNDLNSEGLSGNDGSYFLEWNTILSCFFLMIHCKDKKKRRRLAYNSSHFIIRWKNEEWEAGNWCVNNIASKV
jgi:hypothetical protein